MIEAKSVVWEFQPYKQCLNSIVVKQLNAKNQRLLDQNQLVATWLQESSSYHYGKPFLSKLPVNVH